MFFKSIQHLKILYLILDYFNFLIDPANPFYFYLNWPIFVPEGTMVFFPKIV